MNKETVSISEAPANQLVFETRDLVFETLRQMGCEYEELEDKIISFDYQGENFHIDADNNCLFINIYDLWWYKLSTKCDLKEFANMRKAVNEVNGYSLCTVFYSIYPEAEMFGLHSKKHLIFIRQIPDLKTYLSSTLENFFKVQREVLTRMEMHNVHNDED